MKSFKSLFSEVAQPKSEEEKRFKDQHKVDVVPHPVAPESQHKGTIKPKAKRKADQEGDANYDVAYNESVEQIDEISKKTLGSYVKKASSDMANNAYALGARDPLKKPGSWDKAFKRKAGIEKATNKLTKEEAENLDEISSDLKSRYAKKAQSSLKRATTFKSKAQDDASKASANIDRAYSGDRSVNVNKQYDRIDRADAKAAKHDKTIAKRTAGLKRANEETENLDEISRDKARSYIRKAAADNAERKKEVMKPFPMKDMDKNVEMHKKFKKREAGIETAGKKAYGIGGKAKVNATESVEQLDELSPNTLHSYIKKAAGNMAGNAAVAAAQASSSMKKSSPDVKRKIKNRMQGITGASGRLADKANMAENWQEEIPMMMRQLEFIAYAAEEIMDYVDMAGDPEEWFQNKISGIHQSMLSMYAYAQGGRRAGYGFDESVEEELKGGQKKLDHNKNGKIDAHDFHLMRKKKMKEEVELEEEVFAMDIDYNQEKRLAAGAKAAGIAIKFVQAGGATEMQLRGDKDKITKFLKSRRVPASEISRGWFNEESEQIDEVSQKTLWNYHAKAGADLQKKREKLDKGTLTMKDLKKGQNRVKGLNRAADKMHEEVEVLDEAFKQGIVKLKDGSSVTLNKEDAGLLNQMFKDLSSTNRKKMQEVAMKDKAGFEEILGFAREAL